MGTDWLANASGARGARAQMKNKKCCIFSCILNHTLCDKWQKVETRSNKDYKLVQRKTFITLSPIRGAEKHQHLFSCCKTCADNIVSASSYSDTAGLSENPIKCQYHFAETYKPVHLTGNWSEKSFRDFKWGRGQICIPSPWDAKTKPGIEIDASGMNLELWFIMLPRKNPP